MSCLSYQAPPPTGRLPAATIYPMCFCVCLQALMAPLPTSSASSHGDIEGALLARPPLEQAPPSGACWGPTQAGSSKGMAKRGVAFLRAMGGTTRARAQWEPMATLVVRSQSVFICVYYHEDVPQKSTNAVGIVAVSPQRILQPRPLGQCGSWTNQAFFCTAWLACNQCSTKANCCGFGRPLCPCKGASSPGHAQASTSPHDPVEVRDWMSALE